MKRTLLLLLLGVLTLAATAQTLPLKTQVPPRPAGQKHVLGLVTPRLETVRVGFVGLGMRGASAVERWCHIDGTAVTALCDVRPECVEQSQQTLERNGAGRAAAYSGTEEAYKQLCERPDVDLVYICTDWASHVPIALYAMEHGKHVAIEVPAATSLGDIWRLIDTAERTQLHCMMLENCVYDFFEAATLNMVRHGLLGEVMHVEGSYLHNLDDFWDEYWNNWRLEFNRTHRGDVYPTHGIGPDCQVLGIHRTDLMSTLVSMDTKAVNGPKLVEQRTGKPCTDFQNGDQTSTLIRTLGGKTMLIEHDVLTPRPYSRMYQVVGTDGYASKYPVEQILLRSGQAQEANVADYQNLNAHAPLPDSLRDDLLRRYTPDYIRDIEQQARTVGGHGGMDFIMDYRLVYCLRNGLPLDMDVYDMAEWCCVGELSRLSIEHGSAPVEVPDFTRGAWKK